MTDVDRETLEATEKLMNNLAPKGIKPIVADIGRKVVYRAAPGYEPEEGVITSLGRFLGTVFVRYGAKVISESTSTCDLDWIAGGDSKPPAPVLAPVRVNQGDAEPRKAHYGDGEQPWDLAVRLGWGPAFAAANVVKYLRRTKNPEHSLESARWYWERLFEKTRLEASKSKSGPWATAIAELVGALTTDELLTLRGSAASV